MGELSGDAETGEEPGGAVGLVMDVGRGLGAGPLDTDVGGAQGGPRVSPEHGLHVDDGLGVGHVILLGAHGALLVHHHQVVRVDDAALQQAVQAAGRRPWVRPPPARPWVPAQGGGERGVEVLLPRGALLVHGALHVVDHGKAADGLQEVVVGPMGTAGPAGVHQAPPPAPSPHRL